MTHRDAKLQLFYDLTETAISRRAETCANALPAAKPVFDALRMSVGDQGNSVPERLPVCDALGSALLLASAGPAPIPDLAAALNDLSPHLQWKRRNSSSPNGMSFHDGHANTLVAGPGGLEEREDVWVGTPCALSRPSASPGRSLCLIGRWRLVEFKYGMDDAGAGRSHLQRAKRAACHANRCAAVACDLVPVGGKLKGNDVSCCTSCFQLLIMPVLDTGIFSVHRR
jgi:hypothetical protein